MKALLKNKFFNFQKINNWDIKSIFLYVLFSVFVYMLCVNNTINNIRAIIAFYGLLTHLLMSTILYISLRKLYVFLIWILISIIHFIFYFLTIDNIELIDLKLNIHSSVFLKNTIVFLFLFQLIRFFSLILQKKEFVFAHKHSKFDLLNERETSYYDIFLQLVYIFFVFFINFKL